MVDIIVIGAMKAGSSSMHRYLGNHPEISVTRTKEVNFFIDKNWKKGESWYKEQFKQDGLLHADVSPMYSRSHLHPRMAERAYKTNPDLKIIYVVRSPLERIPSHIMHNMVTNRVKVNADIFEELKENNDYLQTSSYFYQIEKYLEYFKKNQILIVDNFDLKYNFEKELKNIYSFLGVEVKYAAEFENKIYNSSANKRQIKGYDFVYKNLDYKLPREAWFRFFNKFGKKVSRPVLSDEAVNFISKQLEEDYKSLDKAFSTSIANYLK